MSEQRLAYVELAPEGIAQMRALEHYLNTASGLESRLLELVRLRVSLMNGCEYCVELHTRELQKQNEPAERIAGVAEWRDSDAVYAAGAGGAGVDGGGDEYPGRACSGCGVRGGAGALFGGRDGEPDDCDSEDQCAGTGWRLRSGRRWRQAR